MPRPAGPLAHRPVRRRSSGGLAGVQDNYSASAIANIGEFTLHSASLASPDAHLVLALGGRGTRAIAVDPGPRSAARRAPEFRAEPRLPRGAAGGGRPARGAGKNGLPRFFFGVFGTLAKMFLISARWRYMKGAASGAGPPPAKGAPKRARAAGDGLLRAGWTRGFGSPARGGGRPKDEGRAPSGCGRAGPGPRRGAAGRPGGAPDAKRGMPTPFRRDDFGDFGAPRRGRGPPEGRAGGREGRLGRPAARLAGGGAPSRARPACRRGGPARRSPPTHRRHQSGAGINEGRPAPPLRRGPRALALFPTRRRRPPRSASAGTPQRGDEAPRNVIRPGARRANLPPFGRGTGWARFSSSTSRACPGLEGSGRPLLPKRQGHAPPRPALAASMLDFDVVTGRPPRAAAQPYRPLAFRPRPASLRRRLRARLSDLRRPAARGRMRTARPRVFVSKLARPGPAEGPCFHVLLSSSRGPRPKPLARRRGGRRAPRWKYALPRARARAAGPGRALTKALAAAPSLREEPGHETACSSPSCGPAAEPAALASTLQTARACPCSTWAAGKSAGCHPPTALGRRPRAHARPGRRRRRLGPRPPQARKRRAPAELAGFNLVADAEPRRAEGRVTPTGAPRPLRAQRPPRGPRRARRPPPPPSSLGERARPAGATPPPTARSELLLGEHSLSTLTLQQRRGPAPPRAARAAGRRLSFTDRNRWARRRLRARENTSDQYKARSAALWYSQAAAATSSHNRPSRADDLRGALLGPRALARRRRPASRPLNRAARFSYWARALRPRPPPALRAEVMPALPTSRCLTGLRCTPTAGRLAATTWSRKVLHAHAGRQVSCGRTSTPGRGGGPLLLAGTSSCCLARPRPPGRRARSGKWRREGRARRRARVHVRKSSRGVVRAGSA